MISLCYQKLYRYVLGIVFIFCTFSPHHSFSQINPKAFTYTVSYFGNNLWNPGLKFGAEMPKNENTITNKKGKERSILNNYAADIGFYRDGGSHVGVFLGAGWQRKKVFNKRFFITMEGKPLGFYRSFLPETYKVEDDGSIKKVGLPGRFYFAPSVSAGFGIAGKKDTERALFAKVHVITLLPYNTYIMPLLNIELGYQFNLSKN